MSKDVFKQILQKEDVKFLAKHKFGFNLTPKQVEVVKNIVFKKKKRISISAMTRYGKSQVVTIAIALLILFSKNLKIAFIGPKEAQAGILRQYMADLVLKDPDLLNMAQINVTGDTRLVKEASRKRLTFTNGCEYRVFSAEGEAERLMGFGADIVIVDEACLIPDVAWAKITRMLGDNPENAIIIELYNPWDRANRAFEHTLDPDYWHIRIDWRTAVAEGRTTEAFIEEQRRKLTALEFTVLYESEFPDEAEDSLFNVSKLKEAIQREVPEKFLKEGVEKTSIIGVDIARLGLDSTVFIYGYKYENSERETFYEIVGSKQFDKNNTMNSIGELFKLAEEFKAQIINIDCIGLGSTFVDRVKEVVHEKNLEVKEVVHEKNLDLSICECHFGKSPMDKQRFLNLKAENYFKLKDIVNNNQIKLPSNDRLIFELSCIKWELTSNKKVKIIDPDKSPDFADALVYFTWARSNFVLLDSTKSPFF